MNIPSPNTASISQEALETAAQTKVEAAKGDQQAVRKLAKSQVQQNSEPAAPPEGTGVVLNAKV